MAQDIRYPSAYTLPFTPTQIQEALRTSIHYCFGCNQEMVPRQGNIRQHHFAHKQPFTQCASDQALHENAKANICHGLLKALESGHEYHLKYPCQKCRENLGNNIAIPGTGIASERTVIKGTRSDLVVFKEDTTPKVIIEIVVSHDLEQQTKEKYEDAGIPVVKIAPTWEKVSELTETAIGYEGLNVPNPCNACRRKEAEEKQKAQEEQAKKKQKAQEEQAKKKQKAQEEQARQRREQEKHRKVTTIAKAEAAKLLNNMKPRPGKIDRPTPITHDQFRSPLKSLTRQTLNHHANKLLWLGFKQQISRPTLFIFNAGNRQIYADLDSTKIMRIWKVDCQPAIYSFPHETTQRAGCRECILEKVGQILTDHGIPHRRHFEDYKRHDHNQYEPRYQP